jgi:hypothetical protein
MDQVKWYFDVWNQSTGKAWRRCDLEQVGNVVKTILSESKIGGGTFSFEITEAGSDKIITHCFEFDKNWNVSKFQPQVNMKSPSESIKNKLSKETNATIPVKSALDEQVGGGHYKDMKIQVVEFTHANNLDAFQYATIKYVCRHKKKNKLEDLKKAIHYIQLYAKLEYGADL